MKRFLNTLFVTIPGAYLMKDGENVVVKVEREAKLRVPIHMLGGIVCFGPVTVSPPLMGFSAEKNVNISFLDDFGRFYARVQGKTTGNVLLRRAQYRFSDTPPASVGIASAVLSAKVANSRTVLARCARDYPDVADVIKPEVERLTGIHKRFSSESDLDVIRGYEGEAASRYFSVFDHLIRQQKNDFQFTGRNRRPPMDNVNAMLSFLYTVLTHDVVGALESVGLDPAVGFLHRERPGRPSLALDIAEEFRAFLVDRVVLSAINLKTVKGSGFKKGATGGVIMNDETRKNILKAWQERKKDEIRHPFLEETIPIGLLFHTQALLMARHLRGDLEKYPAFIWR